MEINLNNVAKADDTQTALDGKVDKVTGKGLSENDYTTTEKNNLQTLVNNNTGVNTGDQDLSNLQPYAVLSGVSGGVDFASPKIYGTATIFKTGNIILNTTNAKYGVLQKVYHLDSVVPDFGVNAVCISGAYKLNELNIIYYEYAASNRVEYRIVQQFSFKQIRREEMTTNILYCGFANDGSLESEEVWTITKMVIGLNGSVTTSQTLTDVAWSDRGIIF